MSTRRQILDSIADRLVQISGLVEVSPWKPGFSGKKLPAIAWRDKVEVISRMVDGSEWCLLTVIYCGYLNTSASTVRELLYNMLQKIGSDETHGGLAVLTKPVSTNISVVVAESTISACQLHVEIFYQPVEGGAAETNRLQDENQNNLTDENGDNLTW